MRSRIACSLLLALGLAHAAPAQEIDTLALRAHTYFLAHDLLRGRDTGSRGERLAALYITHQLRRLGIPGAAPDGSYRQPMPLKAATIDSTATRVTVTRGDHVASFRGGTDFVLYAGGAGAFRDFTGAAVFAGTADLAAEALGGLASLEGYVVVLLGTPGAEAPALLPDWIDRGAEGVVLLIPEADAFTGYVRRTGERRLYVDADVDDPVWQPRLPMLVAGPALSAALLADVPLTPDALDGTRPFAALPLDRTVEATLRITLHDVPAANVAALLPGTDPERRDEVVAYTAHYDHLGVAEPGPAGDSIYNGFSDNAAGVAMLLAIAEALRDAPPARSVLFLFFTGEERGLLGSSYYARSPVVPLERTTAVINLDAGAPPAPPRSWRIAGGDASTLGVLAIRIAADRGWTAEPSDASPNSDYWPLLRAGVPAVFLIPGAEWDGIDTEQAERLRRRWDHYHQPGDEWKADFPFSGLQRYAEFALALGRAAGDAAERPALLEPTDDRAR